MATAGINIRKFGLLESIEFVVHQDKSLGLPVEWHFDTMKVESVALENNCKIVIYGGTFGGELFKYLVGGGRLKGYKMEYTTMSNGEKSIITAITFKGQTLYKKPEKPMTINEFY